MKKVFIGVGHGGKDPGAVSGGLEEKHVNLAMAMAMKEELERNGILVGISRTADETVGLEEEIRRCRSFAPDIAVEVHNNAGGGQGFEAMCQTGGCAEQSRRLAGCIEAQVCALGQKSRGCKTRLAPNGADYFGWLRQLAIPAVLCEGAFLDNPADATMIDSGEKQRAFGAAYARGVLDYLGIARSGPEPELHPVCGAAACTAEQMTAYLLRLNPNAPDYAAIYLAEGEAEGIRGDVAFAQSCLETNHFRFGGDVGAEQNNFCGLGATGAGARGNSFATPQEGIRAQIQHLKAYGCEEPLRCECVDPRFRFVARGTAPYIEWLGIPDNPQGKGWAAGRDYGKHILQILAAMQGGAAATGSGQAAQATAAGGVQKLILPINAAKLTASMKTESYRARFGFEHYGADLVSTAGNRTLYASGNGTVVATGRDNVVGNVVAVCYPNARHRPTGKAADVVFRYYHLDSVLVREGDAVTKDSRLGLYGCTGSLKMAPHLHLEADTDVAHPLHSPTVSSSNLLVGRAKGANDKTMTSPLEWLHKKVSPPDNQQYTTAGDAYIDRADREIGEVR